MGDVIGGIGNIIGMATGHDAASIAASAASDAAWANTLAQTGAAMNNWKRQKPWYLAGKNAINELNRLMGPGGDLTKNFSPADFQANADPAYQWIQQQGQNSLASQAAAGGNYGSGNMGVALQNYGQNTANQYYNDAYNRYTQNQSNLFNRLASMSGIGQTTAQQLAGLDSAAATNIGQMNAAGMMSAANARMQGAAIGNNFLQSALGQMGSGGGYGGIGNMLSNWFGGSGGGGGAYYQPEYNSGGYNGWGDYMGGIE